QSILLFFFFFFFQAEDGIRDDLVTGVQTCALPILLRTWPVRFADNVNSMAANLTGQVRNIAEVTTAVAKGDLSKKITVDVKGEKIGRASCRERERRKEGGVDGERREEGVGAWARKR